jgi:hypothetical protein
MTDPLWIPDSAKAAQLREAVPNPALRQVVNTAILHGNVDEAITELERRRKRLKNRQARLARKANRPAKKKHGRS